MKFIANLLIDLSNNTIPIAYIFMLLGIILGLLRSFGSLKDKKNNLIIKEITPIVSEIKQKYSNEDEQLEKLNQLYKERHFSTIIPLFIKVITNILYILIFLTIINAQNFSIDNYTKSVSFFNISNIFTRNTVIIIPILLIILELLSTYIYIPKELVDKKTILITVISCIIINFLFSNLFITSYCLFLLGANTSKFILSIPINKIRRETYYKYPSEEPEENIQENEQNNKDINL